MTEQQSQLLLQIVTRLEPFFAADDIRPCRFCGQLAKTDPTNGKTVEHDRECIVVMIRQLKAL
jgi:hypothetical protein